MQDENNIIGYQIVNKEEQMHTIWNAIFYGNQNSDLGLLLNRLRKDELDKCETWVNQNATQ